MNLKVLIKKILPNYLLAHFGYSSGIDQFTFDISDDVKKDIQSKYKFDGDLLDIYASNRNQLVHKWHHYIPIYDQHLSKYRNRKVRILEIGVSEGGSLQMWRKYFGEDAIIFGVDVDPNCYKLNGNAAQVRIGSQVDLLFLQSIIYEMGGVDIILDDGSHNMIDIRKSFQYLFPQLNDGGIYLIEDLHTSYWRGFGGGYRSKSNFFTFVTELIDDMHHWYHTAGVLHPSISSNCNAIHVYDSITIIEKNPVYKPVHSQVS